MSLHLGLANTYATSCWGLALCDRRCFFGKNWEIAQTAALPFIPRRELLPVNLIPK